MCRSEVPNSRAPGFGGKVKHDIHIGHRRSGQVEGDKVEAVPLPGSFEIAQLRCPAVAAVEAVHAQYLDTVLQQRLS